MIWRESPPTAAPHPKASPPLDEGGPGRVTPAQPDKELAETIKNAANADEVSSSGAVVLDPDRPFLSRRFKPLARLYRPTSARPQPGFYPGLDLLRGFAAISVVIYHTISHFDWKTFPNDNAVALWFRMGWLGVDLFFVISGFVIALSALKLLDQGTASYVRDYTARRLARIVPLHYLTCLLAVIFVTPGILFHPAFVWHALAHLSFTHNWAHEMAGSINGPNWSLAVEMQFYVFILIAAPWLRRMRPLTVLGACLAVSWIWRSAVFMLNEGVVRNGVNMTWLGISQVPGQLDLFGYGIALAMFVRSDAMKSLRQARSRVPLALAGCDVACRHAHHEALLDRQHLLGKLVSRRLLAQPVGFDDGPGRHFGLYAQ